MQVMHYMADGTIKPPKPGERCAGYAWLLRSSKRVPATQLQSPSQVLSPLAIILSDCRG